LKYRKSTSRIDYPSLMLRHSSPLSQERPPHTAWRWWLSWGMGALAPVPVIELTSKLQERQLLFGIRRIRRPGRTPVGVFQDRSDGFSQAVQDANDSHRWTAGA